MGRAPSLTWTAGAPRERSKQLLGRRFAILRAAEARVGVEASCAVCQQGLTCPKLSTRRSLSEGYSELGIEVLHDTESEVYNRWF